MNTIFMLRWLHVIGATVLLGTGAGIAFFMVMAHRTRDSVGGHEGKADNLRRPRQEWGHLHVSAANEQAAGL